MNYITPASKPRCSFRRVDFETVKVRIDSQDAGALRFDRKRGWLPDAQLEATLNLYLPAHCELPDRRDAEDYVRAAATLIPPPQEA